MLPELPIIAPVDHSRRGIISLPLEFLAELLGLPPEYEIVAAQCGDGTDIRLAVRGGEMPLHRPGYLTSAVFIVCRIVHAENGERRVFAHFSHAPEKEWRVR